MKNKHLVWKILLKQILLEVKSFWPEEHNYNMYTSLQEQETQLQILQFFKFSERTDSSRGWPHIKLYCISTSLLKFWLERLGRVGQKSVNTISVLKFNQGKNCSSIKMLSTSYIGSQYFHVAIRDSPQKMKEGAMLLQGCRFNTRLA